MVAQQHPVDMPPAVTVLQLDTHFPRIAGDVGCAQSYALPMEVIRVPSATVQNVVSDRPDLIDIAPFEDALRQARGAVVVTSCGFLSYWQSHLQSLTSQVLICSALGALDRLVARFTPDQLMIVTFDAAKLTAVHLGEQSAFQTSIVGLPLEHHLRAVIEGNTSGLDAGQAQAELVDLVQKHQTPAHRHILFECTNLPPYRAAVMAATGLPVTDIMSEIAGVHPNAVAPSWR
ncbi:hypothetical protein [Ascidiaceihabitans sp.]|uniref:hypothetical protein n=1 Tax=Ascidiaceihabitans sp. TaxID=1872644 RepID=UPI0032975C5E